MRIKFTDNQVRNVLELHYNHNIKSEDISKILEIGHTSVKNFINGWQRVDLLRAFALENTDNQKLESVISKLDAREQAETVQEHENQLNLFPSPTETNLEELVYHTVAKALEEKFPSILTVKETISPDLMVWLLENLDTTSFKMYVATWALKYSKKQGKEILYSELQSVTGYSRTTVKANLELLVALNLIYFEDMGSGCYVDLAVIQK